MTVLRSGSLIAFTMDPQKAKRFAAKLLFQFRVVVDGESSRRRTCEERTVVFRAASARSALANARRKGRSAQYRYKNDQGNPVHFEFVGVTDLLCLGPECAPDEVWYDMREMVMPMERRKRILPTDAALLART